MNYRIGLDIGISSVGWAVLENGEKDEPIRIAAMGSRIFDKAEQPKTGESLAAPRRAARSARRRTRRRRHRKDRIKWLFEQSGLITKDALDGLFVSGNELTNVYQLRYEGLDRLLNNEEWARVLLLFAQRRGYKANSKAVEAADEDSGRVLAALENNKKLMQQKGYRTIGEMLWKDERFKGHTGARDNKYDLNTRNKGGDYSNTILRSMLVEEVYALFEAQKVFGSKYANDDLRQEYLNILTGQRSFDEGPGGGPYAGSQIERMIGECGFEQNELRAAKACYTFEYFKLLQDINHIRIIKPGSDTQKLTPHMRQSLIDLAIRKDNLKFSDLRKELKLDDDQLFNSLNYEDGDIKKAEGQKWTQMQSYFKIKAALKLPKKEPISILSHVQLDEIGRILTLYKNDARRIAELEKADIDPELYPPLLTLSFSKFGNLSLTAMKKILPELEKGNNYDVACSAVYGDFRRGGADERKSRLNINDDCEDIANPVVKRAVSQTIKVINAIIEQYGSPQLVCIELARELGKSFDERRKIEKNQIENRAENDRVRAQIEEYKGAPPTGEDIVKFKLWQEQDKICLYSGKTIEVTDLFGNNFQIDHIIPYSLSFDNSYRNKVLVSTKENQDKGQRIPYEHLKGDRWNEFTVRVENLIRDGRKREKLLRTKLNDEDIAGFKERNLTDTKYMTRIVYNLLNNKLLFAPSRYEKKPVKAVNGAITAYVRSRLGITKIRGDGDLHHAVDAAVIATITDGMTEKITRFSQNDEVRYTENGILVDYSTGEVITREQYDKQRPRFPEPWKGFRKELEAWTNPNPAAAIKELRLPAWADKELPAPVFVSRMANHKVTGPAHAETIRSAKMQGYAVSKKPLYTLKLDKNGEIEGYYNPMSDKLLYDALKARLRVFGGKGEKAFEQPFYKPRSDGTLGPVVKKVKLYEKSSLNVPVNGGLAANGSMIRVDIFHVEDEGYYIVPVYVSDTVKDELPNKAIIQKRAYDDWKVMKPENFQFSVYPSDLIKVYSSKGFKLKQSSADNTGEDEIFRSEEMLYYVSTSISTGSIFVRTHDNRYIQESLGIKNLALIEKYSVDVLGKYRKVKTPEKRMDFSHKSK